MELFVVISVLNWELWKVKLFWLGGSISLQCGYYGSIIQGDYNFLLWDIWNWIGEKNREVADYWTLGVSSAAVQDQCHVQLNQHCFAIWSRSVSLIRLTYKKCCVNLHPNSCIPGWDLKCNQELAAAHGIFEYQVIFRIFLQHWV